SHRTRTTTLHPGYRCREVRCQLERRADQRAHDGLTPVTNTEKHTRLLIPHSRSCAGRRASKTRYAPAMTTFAVLRSFDDDLGGLDHRAPGLQTLVDQLAHLLRRAGERIGFQCKDARAQLALLESL